MPATATDAPTASPASTASTIPGDIGSQLQTSVANALASPSRYDLPQVQQVQQALTAQLQQQFNASQTQLNEQMASRGLSASSIGAGYQGDLTGQDNTALANMNASLIQNQAATSAADQSAALGAGQAYQTGQQNYGLNTGALTGTFNGNQTLAAQTAAASNALGFGSLMGSVNGQQTLGGQQLSQNQSQFTASQAQAASIAAAQNATANRGVDANAALAQNQLMLQVANFLAAQGYPGLGSTSTTGSPTPSPNPTGSIPNPAGTSPTGSVPSGTPTGPTPVNPNAPTVTPPTASFAPGAPGAPNYSISAPSPTTTFDPTGPTSSSPTSSLFPSVPSTSSSTPPAPTMSSFVPQLPTALSGTPPPPASLPPSTTAAPSYQTPIFGNSPYTGLFGNSPVQYGATPPPSPSSTPGTPPPTSSTGTTPPSLFPQIPSTIGGMAPPPPTSTPTGMSSVAQQVAQALSTSFAHSPGDPPPVTSGNPMTAGTNGAVWSGTQTPYQQQEIGGTAGETVPQYLAGSALRNGPQQQNGQPTQQYAMQSFFPGVDFNKLPANTTLGQLLSAGAITKTQIAQAFADGNPASIPDNWAGLGETIGATTGL